MKFYPVLLITIFCFTTNTFSQIQFTPHTITSSGATSVFAVDMDGDGDMDVLSAYVEDDKIAWYENKGNENFISSHTITTSADGALFGLCS